MKSKKTRVTIDLGSRSYERLNALQDLTEADSKAQVVRHALQLYEFVAQRTAQGTSFVAKDPEGGSEETVLLVLPTAVS